MNCDEELHNLLFGIRRSVRYHQRRVAFFDRINSFVQVVSVAFGSITVYTVLQQFPVWVSATVAAGVTTIAAIDLVIGTSRMARVHGELARSFINLEREIVRTGEAGEASVRGWTEQRLEIESEEPPVLRVLDSLCHNELVRAMGYSKEHYVRVGWFQRLVAQFLDVGEHSIVHGRIDASG